MFTPIARREYPTSQKHATNQHDRFPMERVLLDENALGYFLQYSQA